LAELTQTLAKATAIEHLLIYIQPETPIFLQDAVVADDVVATALTLQHRVVLLRFGEVDK